MEHPNTLLRRVLFNPWVVRIVTGLIVTLLSDLFFRPKKEPVYSVSYAEVFGRQDESGMLELRWNQAPVQTVYRTVVDVGNLGGVEIQCQDLWKGIRIVPSQRVNLLGAEAFPPQKFKAEVVDHGDSGEYVALTCLAGSLEKGQGVRVWIWYEGNDIETDFRIEAPVTGVRGGFRRLGGVGSRAPSWETGVIILGFVVCLVYGAFLLWDEATRTPRQWGRVWIMIFIGLGLAFAIAREVTRPQPVVPGWRAQ